MKTLFMITVLLSLAPSASAQEFEPSPEHPFGRPNPEATPELEKFAWAIGSWRCDVESLRPDGTPASRKAEWTWTYAFQGMAIEDWTYSSNGGYYRVIRQYDALDESWLTTIFGMNSGAERYTLPGKWVDGEFHLENEAVTTGSGTTAHWRFAFTDITDHSYVWSGYTKVGNGDFVRFQHNVCERLG